MVSNESDCVCASPHPKIKKNLHLIFWCTLEVEFLPFFFHYRLWKIQHYQSRPSSLLLGKGWKTRWESSCCWTESKWLYGWVWKGMFWGLKASKSEFTCCSLLSSWLVIHEFGVIVVWDTLILLPLGGKKEFFPTTEVWDFTVRGKMQQPVIDKDSTLCWYVSSTT